MEFVEQRRVLPCAQSRGLSFWVSLPMGGQFSYARCPESPTEMPKEPSSPKWKLWATACGLALIILVLFTFLVLYVQLRVECESQLWNHTSSAESRMRESDEFRSQLAAVHQSLANTTKHWASCQEELKHSRENTSVLADNVQKKEEALKRLDGEKNRLQDQLAQLRSTLETFKREREEKDKTIQRLKYQLNARQTSSSAVLFGGPISSSLLLIVPGLLCSLL